RGELTRQHAIGFRYGEETLTRPVSDRIGLSCRGDETKGGRSDCWPLSPAKSVQRPSILRVDCRRRDVACILRRARRNPFESHIGCRRGTTRLGASRKPPPTYQELHDHPNVELHQMPPTLSSFGAAAVSLSELP